MGNKILWKEIPGYEGLYSVSNTGVVKSHIRKKNNKTYGGRTLKNDLVTGYYRVSLCKDNIRKNYLVHRLVAMAFNNVENSNELQINHKDFNKKNNNIENLEWITRQENMDHFYSSDKALERSKKIKGFASNILKLNADEINLVKKLRREYGLKVKTIADLFNVHRCTIGDILNGKHWSTVGEV